MSGKGPAWIAVWIRAVIARPTGHRSPAETGVYLHVLKDRPQRAVNRLDLGGEEVNNTMTWEYWICLYTRTHCTVRGLRASTIAAYQKTLEHFRQYVRLRQGDVEPAR